jgi:hypothetical protein
MLTEVSRWLRSTRHCQHLEFKTEDGIGNWRSEIPVETRDALIALRNNFSKLKG